MLARIMIVEDERIVAFNLQRRLSELGYEVPAIAASGEEALRKADEVCPDLVLMDIRIEGDLDGIETASRLVTVHPAPVVYLTAYSEDSTLERARATRPYGYLLKPFSEREMHATIQMALERHQADVALQESEERLRLAMDAAELGIWHANSKNQSMEMLGLAAPIFGLEAGMVPGSWEGLLDQVHPQDRERVRAALQRAHDDLAQYEIEFRRANSDGSVRWVRAYGKGYTQKAGAANRMVGLVQDISEKKRVEEEVRSLNAQLEQRVAERTAQLQASVAELDAFNYSVAHDLRSPIRSLAGFSGMLLSDYAEKLDDTGRHYLRRVQEAGARMNRMIDALLNLSRLSRVALRRRQVDLGAVAGEVADRLRESDPQRGVEFVIMGDVGVKADPGLILVAMENLLGNAWKYTRRRAQAVIEFGVTTSKDEKIYFVRDDGAGFDMAHVDKLFGAFQRLHHPEEFDGTGVGLATVRRIVERHGGRIWARGRVGQGAIFFFTLPDPPAA